MAEHEPYDRQDTEVLPPGAGTDPAPRRDVDAVALVAGVLFALIAVLLMSGVDLSVDWFGHGVAWLLLIGAGVALLVNELLKARRRT